jgi:hypothetical protein
VCPGGIIGIRILNRETVGEATSGGYSENLFVGSANQSVRRRLQSEIELCAVPGKTTIQPDYRRQ